VRTAEILASRILFWGGVASILLMALGIIGWGAPGGIGGNWGAPGDPQAPHERTAGQAVGPLGRRVGHPGIPAAPVYTSVGEVVRAWRQWPVEPLAVVTTGILLLLATPFVGVVAVFVVFVVIGERRYAGIAAVLIAALLVSLAFVSR